MVAFRSIGFLVVTVWIASADATVFSQNIIQGSAAVELKLVTTVGADASTPNFGANTGDPRFLYVGQKTRDSHPRLQSVEPASGNKFFEHRFRPRNHVPHSNVGVRRDRFVGWSVPS